MGLKKSPKMVTVIKDKFAESQAKIPLKKRLRTMEKENQLSSPVKSPSKKHSLRDGSKVLSNVQLSENEVALSEEENESDSDIDDMLKNLKKSGIKVVNNKHSPKTPSPDKKDRSSSKKKPELEKSPDSLILSFKRTPKKKNYDDDFESSSKKSNKSNSARSSPRISSGTNKSRRQIIDDEEEEPAKSFHVSRIKKRKIDEDGEEFDNSEILEKKSKNNTPSKFKNSDIKLELKKSTIKNDSNDSDFAISKKRCSQVKSEDSPKKLLRTPKKEVVYYEGDDFDDDGDFDCRKKQKYTPSTGSLKKTPRTPRNNAVFDKDKKGTVKEEVPVPLLNTPRSTRKSSNGDAGLNSPLSSKVSSSKRLSRIRKAEPLETLEEVRSVKKSKRHEGKDGFEVTTPTSKKDLAKPQTPLQKARQSLNLRAVPDSLPCREKESDSIKNSLQKKLLDETGGCLYIYGKPGTGKSATVSQVIRYLEQLAEDGTLPEFKYIEINALDLGNPQKTYVKLYQKLFSNKERISPREAREKLVYWFSEGNRKNKKIKSTVFLVDEVDKLINKDQKVIYDLLDWTKLTHSGLIVLAIANTMDLPEKLLKKNTSRLGITRHPFKPYDHKQLAQIVLDRLSGLNAFSKTAVELVSRKVAGDSGDARRVLDISRRAAELALPNGEVTISHMERAINERLNSSKVELIRDCSETEKLWLKSISSVSTKRGVKEVEFREVLDNFYALCSLEGVSKPPVTSVIKLSHYLKEAGFIYSSRSDGGLLQKISLRGCEDDLDYALQSSF